jgi:hypothetical protein
MPQSLLKPCSSISIPKWLPKRRSILPNLFRELGAGSPGKTQAQHKERKKTQGEIVHPPVRVKPEQNNETNREQKQHQTNAGQLLHPPVFTERAVRLLHIFKGVTELE